MKLKNIRLIRPEFAFEVVNPLGWFILPFATLYVYAKFFRLIKGNIDLMIGDKMVGKEKVFFLVIPKLNRADAL